MDPTALTSDSIATSLSPSSQTLLAMNARNPNFPGVSAEFPDPLSKLRGHKQSQLIRFQLIVFYWHSLAQNFKNGSH